MRRRLIYRPPFEAETFLLEVTEGCTWNKCTFCSMYKTQSFRVLPEEDIRAIMAHGYGICTDVEPITDMEKSLFTVDELTGIVQAAARMRPNGIVDMEVKSFMKKWKDKRFAAKCDRPLILKGCDMLGMDIKTVAGIVIEGMKAHAEELQLTGN